VEARLTADAGWLGQPNLQRGILPLAIFV